MGPVLRVLCVLVVGACVGACSGTHESHPDAAVPVVAAPVPNLPQLNVSGLLPLSIDELIRRLGPRLPLPAGFTDPVQASVARRGLLPDSAVFLRGKGLALVATYDYRTRQLGDLLLLGTNETELMDRARLRLGAANYLVLPVFQARYPTRLLGLRVLATTAAQ